MLQLFILSTFSHFRTILDRTRVFSSWRDRFLKACFLLFLAVALFVPLLYYLFSSNSLWLLMICECVCESLNPYQQVGWASSPATVLVLPADSTHCWFQRPGWRKQTGLWGWSGSLWVGRDLAFGEELLLVCRYRKLPGDLLLFLFLASISHVGNSSQPTSFINVLLHLTDSRP